MSTLITHLTLQNACLHIIKSNVTDSPGWGAENVWDFEYEYPGKGTRPFCLFHRDQSRDGWQEEFFFCIDELAIDVRTMEALANLVRTHLGFEMRPAVPPGATIHEES